MKIIFFAILPIFALAEKCHLPGRCGDGSLVSAAVVASEIKCIEQCRENPECFWVTYHDDDLHLCEEYFNCTEIVSDQCENCFTSESICNLEKDPTCFVPGLCLVRLILQILNIALFSTIELQGEIVSTLTTNSTIDCLERSRAENSTWFSFDTIHSICLTFRTCPSINEGLNSYLSGQSSCPIKGKQ